MNGESSIKLELIEYPDSILRTVCEEVDPEEDADPKDFSAAQILEEMAKKMYEWGGVGLAAPQVGISKRMIVVDVSKPSEPPMLYKMINPRIIKKSAEKVELTEGCLSLPNLKAGVLRPKRVKVAYLDEKFKPQEIEADSWLARCLQHEIDHLDGKLYIDLLDKGTRSRVAELLQKWQREGVGTQDVIDVKDLK